jgi:hypothetical protein
MGEKAHAKINKKFYIYHSLIKKENEGQNLPCWLSKELPPKWRHS